MHRGWGTADEAVLSTDCEEERRSGVATVRYSHSKGEAHFGTLAGKVLIAEARFVLDSPTVKLPRSDREPANPSHSLQLDVRLVSLRPLGHPHALSYGSTDR